MNRSQRILLGCALVASMAVGFFLRGFYADRDKSLSAPPETIPNVSIETQTPVSVAPKSLSLPESADSSVIRTAIPLKLDSEKMNELVFTPIALDCLRGEKVKRSPETRQCEEVKGYITSVSIGSYIDSASMSSEYSHLTSSREKAEMQGDSPRMSPPQYSGPEREKPGTEGGTPGAKPQ